MGGIFDIDVDVGCGEGIMNTDLYPINHCYGKKYIIPLKYNSFI